MISVLQFLKKQYPFLTRYLKDDIIIAGNGLHSQT